MQLTGGCTDAAFLYHGDKGMQRFQFHRIPPFFARDLYKNNIELNKMKWLQIAAFSL